MKFRIYFGAEDEERLTPFEDDKLKDNENSMFEASSVLVAEAKTRELKRKLIFACFAKIFCLPSLCFVFIEFPMRQKLFLIESVSYHYFYN